MTVGLWVVAVIAFLSLLVDVSELWQRTKRK